MKTEERCTCGCWRRSVTLCPVHWALVVLVILGFGVQLGMALGALR